MMTIETDLLYVSRMPVEHSNIIYHPQLQFITVLHWGLDFWTHTLSEKWRNKTSNAIIFVRDS